jgi:hypothetical protein
MRATRPTKIRTTRERACASSRKDLRRKGSTRRLWRDWRAAPARSRTRSRVRRRPPASRLGLGAGSSCDAGALLAEPTEIVQRLLAAAIADVGGRAPSRVGLAKVEALTQQLARAYAAGAPFSANVAGARVRLARGALRVAPEPPRRSATQPRVRG